MKNNLLLIWLILLLLLSFCNKPKEQKKIAIKKPKVKEKVIKKKKNKVVLVINGKKYHENDFKSFIKLNYKSFSDIKLRDRIYSYIFEKYVIQRMLLHKSKMDNFEYNKEQLLENIKSKFNSNQDDINELLNAEIINSYINSKVYNNIKIKEKDIRKHYNKDNNKKYRRKAEVHLFEIMLNDKKKANEIRAILNTKPYKFSEIAKTESKSKIAKENGSLGFINPDNLPESFKKFIKSVPLNKVTPVVEFLYGEVNGKKVYTYHIFKVTKRKKERLLFYSKVKKSIKKELISQKKQELYNELIESLSSTLDIKIITENLSFKYIKKK